MRIVQYDGHAVKRQRKISDNEILITFYSREPLVVTPQEWERNAENKYFDDPSLRRRDVVRQAVASH